MKIPLAEFQCKQCNHEWKENSGPTKCPSCGHLYVNWKNYQQFTKDKGASR